MRMSSEVKAPQNPLSAYAYFFKETQNSIKSQQPNATFESVSKIVETMWQALEEDQKEKYRWAVMGLRWWRAVSEGCVVLQDDERGGQGEIQTGEGAVRQSD